MKSVMTHRFSEIPSAEIPRSVFNRSNGFKTTFSSGYLVPMYLDEVLPGDTCNLKATFFARLATPIVPIMDNLYFDTFWFFVPYRLIWDNWERFNGAQDNPGDSTDYLIPQILSPEVTGESPGSYFGGWTEESLADYFGLPTKVANLSVSALPFRAYNLIYNEWFRSENLQDSLSVPKDDVTYQDLHPGQHDGDGNESIYQLRRRGKRHDYFTSALPWPQKGPGVELSLGTSAPVYGDGNQMMTMVQSNGSVFGLGRSVGSTPLGFADSADIIGSYIQDAKWGMGIGRYGSYNNYQEALKSSENNYNGYPLRDYNAGPANPFPASGDHLDPLFYATKKGIDYANQHKHENPDQTADITSGLYADLTQAYGVTINSMREAFQVQKLLERDARGGTRYGELILAHFGIRNPDARLQRPEYLGGSSTRIIFTPVAQTGATDAVTPQGNVAAYATMSTSKHGFTRSFTEHGIVMGLMNVRADLTYQQGIERFWKRLTRWDFYWPSLSHLGEQIIRNDEIFAQGTDTDNDAFGYQERYAEYRYKNSLITGKLRSNASQSLDVWHLSQYFESLPELGPDFIEDNPPVSRVIAVQNEPEFILDAFFDKRDVRPMPVYSVPGLVDHF